MLDNSKPSADALSYAELTIETPQVDTRAPRPIFFTRGRPYSKNDQTMIDPRTTSLCVDADSASAMTPQLNLSYRNA